MADEAGVDSVRKDEYKEAIITWRHLQNVRYAIIGASITGFVGLIGAFQLAFPREAPAIEFGMAASNPRLYVVSIIPFAGMILGLASMLSLLEWYWERVRLLAFGFLLEHELGLVSPLSLKSKGFFTLATSRNDTMFFGNFAFTYMLMFVSVWAWNGARQEVDAYKAQLPRPVVTEPQKGTVPLLKVPSQVTPKEKSK